MVVSIVAIISFLLFLYFMSSESETETEKMNINKLNLKTFDDNILTDIFAAFDLRFIENTNVSKSTFLNVFRSVVYVESGFYVINGYENSDVKGDGGVSAGFSQVGELAYIDVVNAYKYEFSYEDVKNNKFINLKTGQGYLSLGIKKASKLNLNDTDTLKYAVYMYNRGIDESFSENILNDSYVLKVFNVYNNLI